MLNIKKFVCNMFQENCYVASDGTSDCVVVDCGAFATGERNAVVQYITDNKLNVRHLICTHGHIDHNFGNNTIFNEFWIRPEVHANDEPLMLRLTAQAAVLAGVTIDYDMPSVEKYLREGDIITFGNHEIKVLETPGHTPGSVFFHIKDENVAFSGDTLFRGSIGRTDLEGGSMLNMIQSLRMVSQLPDKTIILPGHGEQTTIAEELANNPYMDR